VSGIPAVCILDTNSVVQTVSYALDTSSNMAAVYAHSLNLSVTYSVTRSSRSVVSRPGKKAKSSSGMLHDSAVFVYRVFLPLLCPWCLIS
jgi:hypothetical protein